MLLPPFVLYCSAKLTRPGQLNSISGCFRYHLAALFLLILRTLLLVLLLVACMAGSVSYEILQGEVCYVYFLSLEDVDLDDGELYNLRINGGDL